MCGGWVAFVFDGYLMGKGGWVRRFDGLGWGAGMLEVCGSRIPDTRVKHPVRICTWVLWMGWLGLETRFVGDSGDRLEL